MEESTALDIVPPEDLRWEGTRDPLFDPLLVRWLEIAATAWEGYRTRGRGVVLTTLAGGRVVDIGYYPGSPCDCHAELVAHYEPSEQVIVVVHDLGPSSTTCCRSRAGPRRGRRGRSPARRGSARRCSERRRAAAPHAGFVMGTSAA